MIRLELLCAPEDREGVIETLRPLLDESDRLIEVAAGLHPASLEDRPIHERVTGRLERILLLLEIDDEKRDKVFDALSDLHLQQRVRWTCRPVSDSGQLGG